MKKAFLTLATIVAALSMTAGAHAAASCEKDVQAAGEDFAAKYMDIGVVPAKTLVAIESVSFESRTAEDSVTYVVTTINNDATRLRSVVVRVDPQTCKIRSLEAIN